ncbi:hypothetical protein VTH06DRAFT_7264 [Thermothelomyces fergusii]
MGTMSPCRHGLPIHRPGEWSTELDPEYQITSAFAYSESLVKIPSDSASNIAIQDSLGLPIYDLAVAQNSNFDEIVGAL